MDLNRRNYQNSKLAIWWADRNMQLFMRTSCIIACVKIASLRIAHRIFTMHTLELFYTFFFFFIYTIICSNSYYTQVLRDFSDFCGDRIIDQKSRTISVRFIDQWAAAKLSQILLLDWPVFRWQIYLPPGGYQ